MPKGNKGYLTDEEKKFIRDNCFSLSDKKIAEQLNRDERTVRSFRINKLGIKKGARGQLPKDYASDDPEKALRASANLSDKERAEFFRTQLTNSRFYHTLKQQLTEEEIEFYLEEWGALCVQFEDILATEKRQIDELIKAEVMDNRVMRSIRVAEDEIEKLAQRVEELRQDRDMDNDEAAQAIDQEMCDMIRTMASQTNMMANDHNKFVDLKNKILEHLHGRRKDRLHKIEKSKTTFIGLVEALREEEIRKVQGRHMTLLGMAKDNKKDKWRKESKFPDGSTDSILLDDAAINTPKSNKAVADILTNPLSESAEEIDKLSRVHIKEPKDGKKSNTGRKSKSD